LSASATIRCCLAALLHGPAGLTDLAEAERALLRSKVEAHVEPEIISAKTKVTKAMAEPERGYRAGEAQIGRKRADESAPETSQCVRVDQAENFGSYLGRGVEKGLCYGGDAGGATALAIDSGDVSSIDGDVTRGSIRDELERGRGDAYGSNSSNGNAC
jgi:hypothetical protein